MLGRNFRPKIKGNIVADLGAYAGSEVAARFSRLFVVIAMARSLEVWEVGVAALALALGDMIKGMSENGVNQRIVQIPEQDLEAATRTAFKVCWMWCGIIGCIQLIAAGIAALVFDNVILAVMLVILAGQYVFMPGGQVNCALAMRERKLKSLAGLAAAQVSLSNFLSFFLLLIWPSAFSLIIPKLLTAPFWLIVVRRIRPWRYKPVGARLPIRGFVVYGVPILGVEMLRMLRQHADKLIIGAVAGAEFLGYYYFAFNAGLGIATTFTVSFSTVIYPHLCKFTDKNNRQLALRKYMFGTAIIAAPLIILQAVTAPIYVPLIFGPEWVRIIPAISILCLTALPIILWSAIAQWLRSTGETFTELLISIFLTTSLIANLFLMIPLGLTGIAVGFLSLHIIILGGAALWVFPLRRYVFS